MNLYDHEELACRRVAEELSQHIGTVMDLESFCQKAVDLFAKKAGLIVEPVTFWNERDKCYQFQFQFNGRVEPEKYGFDFERQQWEVRHDIADIEPEKVGITPPKFNPDQLHVDDPVKYLAKQLDVTERELRAHAGHGHSHDGSDAEHLGHD